MSDYKHHDKYAVAVFNDLIQTHLEIQIQNPFLMAQSTQIKSVISVPIKDFIHHYPRALFNDIPTDASGDRIWPH